MKGWGGRGVYLVNKEVSQAFTEDHTHILNVLPQNTDIVYNYLFI